MSEIASALCKAALVVCGKKTRHVANPRTVGREEELNELYEAISKAVSERNEALARGLPPDIIAPKKSDLKTARGNMKKRLKTLESEWWEKIMWRLSVRAIIDPTHHSYRSASERFVSRL